MFEDSVHDIQPGVNTPMLEDSISIDIPGCEITFPAVDDIPVIVGIPIFGGAE